MLLGGALSSSVGSLACILWSNAMINYVLTKAIWSRGIHDPHMSPETKWRCSHRLLRHYRLTAVLSSLQHWPLPACIPGEMNVVAESAGPWIFFILPMVIGFVSDSTSYIVRNSFQDDDCELWCLSNGCSYVVYIHGRKEPLTYLIKYSNRLCLLSSLSFHIKLDLITFAFFLSLIVVTAIWEGFLNCQED